MTVVVMHLFWMGALSVAVLFLILWIIHLILKNAAVVDIGWGLGFILLAAVYIVQAQGFNLRNTIYFLMVLCWGTRLAVHIFQRIRLEKQEDRRYQKIRQNLGPMAWLKFLLIFEFQAGLVMLIGTPLIVVILNPLPGIAFFEIAGAIIFTLALIGETVSDAQLHAFKQDHSNKGKTCDTGWWHYSRHPNYFFEWLLWVGLFIYALGSPWGGLAIISPMVMFYLLMYVSGVPLAEEQSLKSRGDEYRRYQATTSVFFPTFKRGV